MCGIEDMCTKLETLKKESEKLLQQKEQLEASLLKQDAIVTKHTERKCASSGGGVGVKMAGVAFTECNYNVAQSFSANPM